MDLAAGTSVWVLAGLIFSLRVLDVSLGTTRTIAVVQGRVAVAAMLGFVEILIWVVAISQVIAGVGDRPILMVAYAAGFAVGNAVGITLERHLAVGAAAIRVVSAAGHEIARAISPLGHVVATFDGLGPAGPVVLVYATCTRRGLGALIERARAVDPELFYVVERFAEVSRLAPVPPPTGWRAVLKKK